MDSNENLVNRVDLLEGIHERKCEEPRNSVSNSQDFRRIGHKEDNLEYVTRLFVLKIFKGKSQNAEY